jgi:hypothetical protein
MINTKTDKDVEPVSSLTKNVTLKMIVSQFPAPNSILNETDNYLKKRQIILCNSVMLCF